MKGEMQKTFSKHGVTENTVNNGVQFQDRQELDQSWANFLLNCQMRCYVLYS